MKFAGKAEAVEVDARGELEVHEERGVMKRPTLPKAAKAAKARADFEKWQERESKRLAELGGGAKKVGSEKQREAFRLEQAKRVQRLHKLDAEAHEELRKELELPGPFYQKQQAQPGHWRRPPSEFWLTFNPEPVSTSMFSFAVGIDPPHTIPDYIYQAPDLEHWATVSTHELKAPQYWLVQRYRYWLPASAIYGSWTVPFSGECTVEASMDASGAFSIDDEDGWADATLAIEANLRHCPHEDRDHDYRDTDTLLDSTGAHNTAGRFHGRGFHHVQALSVRLQLEASGATDGCYLEIRQFVEVNGVFDCYATFDLNGTGTIRTPFPTLRVKYANPTLSVAKAEASPWLGAVSRSGGSPLSGLVQEPEGGWYRPPRGGGNVP